MNKKIIVFSIICGLLLGLGFGFMNDSNIYPFIIQPDSPFNLGATATKRGDNLTSDTLPTIMAKPDSKTYLYLRTSVNCSDINIYALEPDQTTADTPPTKVIPAQQGCEPGSFIDTEIITESDRQITIESDQPFTYVAFQGVEGDEVKTQSGMEGDQDA